MASPKERREKMKMLAARAEKAKTKKQPAAKPKPAPKVKKSVKKTVTKNSEEEK